MLGSCATIVKLQSYPNRNFAHRLDRVAEEVNWCINKPLCIEWEDSREGRNGSGGKSDDGGDGRKQYEGGPPNGSGRNSFSASPQEWDRVSRGSDGRGELPQRAVELTSHFDERQAIAPEQFGMEPDKGGE